MKHTSTQVSPELTTWQVPSTTLGGFTALTARAGEHTTIVGANGAGKSSLGFWLDSNTHGVPVSRIIAHRKLWFQSAAPGITAADRGAYQGTLDAWSRSNNSRYLDNADSQRTNIVLFDAWAAAHAHDAESVRLFRSGLSPAEVDTRLGPPFMDRLNIMLGEAGLSVQLELKADQTFVVHNASGVAPYPIFQMSDGEKSALLLASQILAAPSSSIQIIDEPERHLHRAISAGLIRSILDQRPDCHFVVITHDLDLAASLRDEPGQTFSLMGSAWAGDTTTGWDLLPVTADSAVPESARQAILGGRRDIMFIEGEATSLDLSLYSLLLPGWGLFPAGGADQVVRNVVGLRQSETLHWVNARGIVDGDARTPDERQALLGKGVNALTVSEVENLYFVPECIREVSSAQAASLGKDAGELFEAAFKVALAALTEGETLTRLALKLAAADLRRHAVDSIPDQLKADESTITVVFQSPLPEIMQRLEAARDASDLGALVKEVPVRDTALPSRVARTLGFINTSDYEAAVRVRVRETQALKHALVERLGGVPTI